MRAVVWSYIQRWTFLPIQGERLFSSCKANNDSVDVAGFHIDLAFDY